MIPNVMGGGEHNARQADIQGPKDKPPVVRITLEAYTALEEISAKTGLSNCFVASQMILYAAKNTEIKTEDER